MLKHFDMKNCASKSIFMKKKIQLDIDDSDVDESFCETDKKCYQQIIKSLLYLSLKIRSDILFVIAILSQFIVNFYEKHKIILNQIFHYFKNILDVEIIYYIIKSVISTNYMNVSFAHSIVKKDQQFMSEYIFSMIDESVS